MHNNVFDTVFNCPYCHTTKVGGWGMFLLDIDDSKHDKEFSERKVYSITCNQCKGKTIIVENYLPEDKTTKTVEPIYDVVGPRIVSGSPRPRIVPVSHQILFPIGAADPKIPVADPSMPDEFRKTYNEAASVFDLSPRASAALIRMTLEAYLKYYYDRDRGNLYRMIELFSSDNDVPEVVHKVMNIIREEGNDNVHANLDELSSVSQDVKKEEVLPLFQYINSIAKIIAVFQQANETTEE